MSKHAEFVFHRVLEIDSPNERIRFLDEICADSPELREQVANLLIAYEKAGDFLETGPELNPDEAIAITGDPTEGVELNEQRTIPPKFDPTTAERTWSGQKSVRIFDDYELLEKIAQGGMGVVYRARQVSLNRIVAVKMILAGQFASDEEVQRFHIEAEAAAHIDHPGIVPIFDVGCCDGQHFFSMGLIEGQSLAQKIKEGVMPPRTAAGMIRKISLAMHVAHQNGVVHRDLKPGNVLLDKHDEPRVTDFGLAKRVEGDSQLTTTGMIMGTPSYMPPEQASGKKIGPAADVYSLGAMLYALLTGVPPFDGDGQIETLMQVIHDEPIAPRKRVAAIPKDLEAICLKCLEKTPEFRYQTAADLADDLERFLAGEPISAKNDLKRRFRKWTLREPVLAAQLATTFALMIIIWLNYLIFGHVGIQQENLRMLWLFETILAASAITAVLLQKLHNVLKNKNLIPFMWAAINPFFVTWAIGVSYEPRGILFSIYLLLMITICFFRRVELVVVATISSLLGFCLILFFVARPQEFPPSYKVSFGLTLMVGGMLLSFLALRMKRLGQRTVS